MHWIWSKLIIYDTFLKTNNTYKIKALFVSLLSIAKNQNIFISEFFVKRKKDKKVDGMLETVEKSRAIIEKNIIPIEIEHQKEKNYECKQMRAHWQKTNYNCYYRVISIRLELEKKENGHLNEL